MFADFVFVWYNIHKDRIWDLRQRDGISAPNRFQSIDFPKIYQMNGIPKKSSIFGGYRKRAGKPLQRRLFGALFEVIL